MEYGENSLLVYGATVFQQSFYLASNKGVFKKDKDLIWKNVLPDHSVHNISSDQEQLCAMTYNALLLSSPNGVQWQSIQAGLPKDLYTFNILNQNEVLFAGQWDGVYKKTNQDFEWKKSSTGLPDNFAATNMKAFNGVMVITTAERKLK